MSELVCLTNKEACNGLCLSNGFCNCYDITNLDNSLIYAINDCSYSTVYYAIFIFLLLFLLGTSVVICLIDHYRLKFSKLNFGYLWFYLSFFLCYLFTRSNNILAFTAFTLGVVFDAIKYMFINDLLYSTKYVRIAVNVITMILVFKEHVDWFNSTIHTKDKYSEENSALTVENNLRLAYMFIIFGSVSIVNMIETTFTTLYTPIEPVFTLWRDRIPIKYLILFMFYMEAVIFISIGGLYLVGCENTFIYSILWFMVMIQVPFKYVVFELLNRVEQHPSFEQWNLPCLVLDDDIDDDESVKSIEV